MGQRYKLKGRNGARKLNDSNKNISADGRITLLFILMCSLLLFDLVSNRSAFQGKTSDHCEQLYIASFDKLAVKSCSEADPKQQSLSFPARFSPFFYAAMPINSSSREMLMTVQGIGPAMAEDIIAYRRHFGPFTSSEDLLKVPGIGPKRAARFANDFSFVKTP
jgi:competence ComEA-like helix-hairpin-helix protein